MLTCELYNLGGWSLWSNHAKYNESDCTDLWSTMSWLAFFPVLQMINSTYMVGLIKKGLQHVLKAFLCSLQVGGYMIMLWIYSVWFDYSQCCVGAAGDDRLCPNCTELICSTPWQETNNIRRNNKWHCSELSSLSQFGSVHTIPSQTVGGYDDNCTDTLEWAAVEATGSLPPPRYIPSENVSVLGFGPISVAVEGLKPEVIKLVHVLRDKTCIKKTSPLGQQLWWMEYTHLKIGVWRV